MNLLKTLATVSSLTFVSRILGVLRDTVIFRVFGAGLVMDAFIVAFRIPNLLRRLFAEGAFSQAFVPVLAEYKQKRGPEATKKLVDGVASILALALFIISILGILAAPFIIYISASGFAAVPEKFDLTVELLRYTFPYIFFISLVSLAGGILNTHSRFSIPAITPALLNLSFIACALWLAPYLTRPIFALAWAVLLGGLLQLAIQIPFLWRLRLLPRISFGGDREGVGRILKLMGPAVFGVSVGQISLLINTIFASYLVTGSISWLYGADRLMEFPNGMLGVALGTILLPSLARHYADSSLEKYSQLLDWGLRLTLLLAIPAAAALAIIAIPLIATLFFYGEFTAHDVYMTRQALVAYSVGLVGFILVKVLAPGFYARQNIRTPVKIAIFTLVSTQIMNLMFIYPLKHAGLALSIGLGACLNAGLLFYKLRRHHIFQPQPGWGAFLLKLFVAVLGMATVVYFLMGNEADWLKISAGRRVLSLLGLVVAGGATYFVMLFLMGIRLRQFMHRGAE